MFRILLVLFILVPILEIAVFIQVGEQIGLTWTILIVIVTAVVGVNLLKQQGFKAWQDIQLSLSKGNMPAIEMAAAAQLLFAGALLLTPGFVTDIVGFILMVPQVRTNLAKLCIAKGVFKASQTNSYYQATHSNEQPSNQSNRPESQIGRTIEGEFENKDK